MIQAIKELNFPPYATLSQATATMHDMGDRTITADIKIDGAITPDFSYDWEVEFKGDKYIQPLRKPQGSKGDKSSMSTINLTFYHWAIYQLKRYFFVELASTQAGTAFADKYIVPLSVNLGEFVVAFSNVLSYYFPDGDIYIDLNPAWESDAERKYIDINNTYLWDVLQKTHELFSVRWVMERDTNGKYAIRIDYPAGELTHIFEYGFEGGLLNIERQVQDANIRNKILGRGGSKNIPYLYFKDFDKYPQGGDGNQGMIPDPDAIPELSNIYFSELRDSNFRSYVQGWKTNANRLLIEGDTLDEFDAERAKTDYAYMRGATDTKFDPVEYVKDDASIAEYGELVGRLENNEEIFPSLQGMEIDITVPGGKAIRTRADEVVAVQEVVTDRIASDEQETKSRIQLEAKIETRERTNHNNNVCLAQTINLSSNEIEVPDGYEGTLFDAPTIKYTLEWKERIKQYMQYKQFSEGDKLGGIVYEVGDTRPVTISYKVIDVLSNKEVHPVNMPPGRYRIDYTLKFKEITVSLGIIHAQQTPSGLGQTERVKIHWFNRLITASAAIICESFNGDVILNKVDGVSISKSVSVEANSKSTISISGNTFSVPPQGALMVDVPISVTPAATTTYSEKTIKVVNANTNEIVPATNIPEGEYKLLVDVALINESSSAKTLKVELLPAYLYFADNTEKWEPTFDVWIKNIFNTKKSDYASEAAYVEGVWSPLRTEDEMVLTFSSGNLSGHDGWEFKVKKDGIAYDNSRVIVDANGNEVRSEWRLTLIKSDAELETIKKYIPYKDFNAKAGDTFFFTGIILPHQYVLSAEKDVTSWKQDNLAEVKDIKPQWVISLDKVRAHREDADRLIDSLQVGAVLTLKDRRFTKNVGEKQILQSITFEWQETFLLPNIDVVLSDKVTTSLSTTAMLQGKVDALAKQVGGLSNLEQIIRKIGDLLYLRKDGFEDISYSPTRFADIVSSENFKPGAIGGAGWGAYQDENGQSIIEADKLFIRNEMQVNSLIVNQIAALGGTKILSAADMTISAVEAVVLDDGSVGERCFFDTKGSSKSNLFAVDDIAYSNVFDSENLELKYYKRRVIEIGVDYITLSTIDKDGEGSPQVGDVIVQFGNFTDTARQSFIIIDPLNGGKIEIYSGVNSYNLTDRNMVGMGVNPNNNEAYLYGYGDMFFGDRDLKKNFITFRKKSGDKDRTLHINADISIGSDSSGLENFSEWRNKQKQIDKAQTDASQAIKDAENAQKSAGDAQTAANNASSKAEEAIGGISTLTGTTQNLSTAISALDKAKANAAEVYKKSEADGKISDAEQNAIDAANASLELARQELNEAIAEAKGIADSAVAANSTLDAKITDISNGVTESVAEINARLDGVVENYFEEGDPTDPDNPNNPALKWMEDEKKDHIGDTYTNILSYDKDPDNAGKSWRWTYSDSEHTGYHWHPIADSDAVKALLEASKAQTAADRKSKTFVDQPKNYKKGDLWLLQSDDDHAAGKKGDILTAKQDSETYSASHWEKAVRYTDDTTASAALSTAETAIENASQADTKAQNAQSTANAAQGKLNSWLEDGVISPVEKTALANELESVKADFQDISNDCNKYGIPANDTTYPRKAFIDAYNTYEENLEYAVNNLSDGKVISQTTAQSLKNYQEDYYMYRTAILSTISTFAKELADNAQRTADEAKSAADAAKLVTDNLNNDLVFSLTEKRSIRSKLKDINPSETPAINVNTFMLGAIESKGSGSWSKVTDEADDNYGWYVSDMHTDSSYAIAKVNLVNVVEGSSVTVHIMSRAESTYDYTMLGAIDAELSSPTDTTTGIVAHTRGKQGQDISYTFTNLKAGSHFFCVYYRKDGSTSTSPDNGYFKIDDALFLKGSLGDYLALCKEKGISGSDAITKATSLFAYLYGKGVWDNNDTVLNKSDDFRNRVYGLFQDYYAAITGIQQEITKSDYEYLTEAFGKSKNLNVEGVVMSQLMAVRNKDEEVEAIFNGSDYANDTSHGKLILAGGIPEETSSGSTDLKARTKEANTRIYEDGHVETNDIEAVDGTFSGALKLKFQTVTAGTTHTLTESDSSSIYLPVGYITSTELVLPNNDVFDGIFLNVFCYPRITKGEAISRVSGTILCPGQLGIGSNVVSEIEFPNGGFAQFTYSALKQEWVLTNLQAKASLITDVREVTSHSTADEKKLSLFDRTVIVNNSSAITLTLPSNPIEGQTYRVIHVTTSMVTWNGNGKTVTNVATGNVSTSFSARRSVVLTYYNGVWYVEYIQISN